MSDRYRIFSVTIANLVADFSNPPLCTRSIVLGIMEEESEGAPLYVWIGLSIIAAISFWCQVREALLAFANLLNVLF